MYKGTSASRLRTSSRHGPQPRPRAVGSGCSLQRRQRACSIAATPARLSRGCRSTGEAVAAAASRWEHYGQDRV